MFTLNSIIDDLRVGDLSSTAIGIDGMIEGEDDNKDIKPLEIKKLVILINKSLLELCTNYPIFTKSLDLMSIDYLSMYDLTSDHALTNIDPNNKEPRYIIDTSSYPFTDDIIYITNVTNEIGQSLPINDKEQYASVFLPSYNRIQLTHVGYNQIFNIVYRANHPIILFNGSDINLTLNQKILIPPALKTLLIKKVASDYYSALGGSDNNNTAQKLMGDYNNEMMNMTMNGTLGMPEIPTNIKAIRRGFP